MITNTNSHYAVAKARNSTDVVILAITFGVLFILSSGYFVISGIKEATDGGVTDGLGILGAMLGGFLTGAFLFVAFLVLGMIMVRMQRQQVLGNTLEVRYSDYAWLRDWSNQVAADFNMPPIEIFITQDPTINAYAFGFARPYCIVLNSATIRYLTDDELRVVVAHEMGHIKYGHTIASVFLNPFLSLPVIGLVGGYIAGF